MSEPALTGPEGFTDAATFAFADPAAGFFGLARAGVASGPEGLQGSALGVLFAGREPVGVVAEGGAPLAPDADWDELRLPGLVTRTLEPHARWHVALDAPGGAGFELEFAAASPPAELAEDDEAARIGGMVGHERLCRVTGTAGGRPIDCLGQRGRSWGVADWSRIALTRSLAAWLEDGGSLTVAAIRPEGAESHADEATWGALLDPEDTVRVADPRVSTTYDARRAPAPRRPRAVGGRGRRLPPPRRGPGAVRLLRRARAAAPRLRVLRLAARRARGRRALRRGAAGLANGNCAGYGMGVPAEVRFRRSR